MRETEGNTSRVGSLHRVALQGAARDLVDAIAEVIPGHPFRVYGGRAISLAAGESGAPGDIDLAFHGRATLGAVWDNLSRAGYETLAVRDYFINIDSPVTLLNVRGQLGVLDVGFLDDPSEIGQFSVESIQIRHPEYDFWDPHAGLRALRAATLVPIRGLDSENPNLLLGRLILLAGKYGFKLADHPLHRDHVRRLNERIAVWSHGSFFHDVLAPQSLLSLVLRAFLHRMDREALCVDLAGSAALTQAFPELHAGLNSAGPGELAAVQSATGAGTLARALLGLVPREGRSTFSGRLSALATRQWDSTSTDAARASVSQPAGPQDGRPKT